MLKYEKIHILEGIDVNKSPNKSKECSICHYWYFLDKYFNHEPYLSLSIVTVKGNSYRINFSVMSKNDAINLLNNSVLNNKRVL